MLDPKRNYYTVVISSYVIFRKGDEVLLSRRFNTGYQDGNYNLPAGHIEAREFARAAAVREAFEEVGVKVDEDNLKTAHIMHRRCAEHDRIDFFFTADKWEGELVNAEPNKCDQIAWFSLWQLPENTCPYIKSALEHFRDGKVYSEFVEG